MLDSRSVKDTFDRVFDSYNTIFVTAHSRLDFDAVGSLLGMSLLCKKNKKKVYVIVDDNIDKLDNEIKKELEELKDCIIKTSDIDISILEESLLITVDVNKDYLISQDLKGILNKFMGIIVFDHHKSDEHTIKACEYYIDDKLSSCCEEISRILFSYGIKITSKQANYLLAGIILDTNKLSKNVSTDTLKVVSRLSDKGANINEVNNMFLEDYENDRKMLKIVSHTEFLTFIYAIASDNEDSTTIYQIEDIAKTADYLLKYKIDASFALGYIDEDTVSISARSKGNIDVSSIMKLFGGGGNEFSAATKIKGISIDEIKKKLIEVLKSIYCIDNKELQDGPVLRLKQ